MCVRLKRGINFLFLLLTASFTFAQPQFNWGSEGVIVSADAEWEVFPQLVSDDEGGAIIVWMKQVEEGIFDIYAQRIDASIL